ncbi:PEP-CTERM sorting domain-containing protein [Methylomonas sp. TEB]|uniref:PEP-CTERM sorting domain-containing protein n=1 Tax=Methylomonas sp. TEB TaxID=3398229 RepID=UPI0039F478FB
MRINPPLLAAGLLLSLTTLTAEATLTPYTSGGQSLVYSSISDVTWTGDGNLLGTLEASNPNLVSTIISTIGSVTDTPNAYDTPANSGSHTLSTADFGANGRVNWFGAQAYVSYLNTINYAGSNQWALPTAGADPQLSYNQTDSQFGKLYYNELNKLAPPYPGYIGPFGIFGDGRWGTSGTAGPFSNAQSSGYWSGTEVAPNPGLAWIFFTYDGYLDRYFKIDENLQFFAWAVSPGQVSAVPVPGAVWLMGTGLVGLLSLKRRGHAG